MRIFLMLAIGELFVHYNIGQSTAEDLGWIAPFIILTCLFADIKDCIK